ncbi:hypothetical protein SEA_MARGARET_61 [Gordonia phage Margaret]|nr:hypothetical protein SEA_MARGARET_61 [Gordonia phage Margaret]
MSDKPSISVPPETDLLCIALCVVAQESTQPDLVRTVMIALYETELGREYVRKFPLSAAAGRFDIMGAHIIDKDAFYEGLRHHEEQTGRDYPGAH